MTDDRRTRRVPARYDAFLQERNLDPQIAWGLGNVIAAGSVAVALLEERVLRDAGLTNAGWRLLVTVYVNGPTEPRELARLLYLSRPAVVNGLNTLERARLITRVPDDNDRRLVRAVATDSGGQTVERLITDYYDVQCEMLGQFDPSQRDALISLTGQFAYAARKLHERTTAERPRGPLPRTTAGDREEDAAI